MHKEAWAFIDYENGATLDGIELMTFSKVYVFIGARQNRINLGDEKIELLSEIHFLKLKATSPDNLDFHISYYLGKFDALADSDVKFVVVSNDTGFDPLIMHLNENGRFCERQKFKAKAPVVNQLSSTKKDLPLSDERQLKLVKRLKSTEDSKRPKTEKALKGFVKSHLGLNSDNVSVQREFSKLIKSNIVKVEGKNIKYQL
jgi:hypothetical protein